MEFRDFLFTRYNVYLTIKLQSNCDGFVISFNVSHTLICRKGVIFVACHNKVCDKLLYLSRRAFKSESVRAEPLINKGRTRS